VFYAFSNEHKGDGFRCKDGSSKVSVKHATSKQAMRNGIVDSEQAENYILFKKKLKDLCRKCGNESPFNNSVVVGKFCLRMRFH